MSALPPKADIRPRDPDVCFGPGSDICTAAKAPYSITSSARARSGGGTVRPRKATIFARSCLVTVAPPLHPILQIFETARIRLPKNTNLSARFSCNMLGKGYTSRVLSADCGESDSFEIQGEQK